MPQLAIIALLLAVGPIMAVDTPSTIAIDPGTVTYVEDQAAIRVLQLPFSVSLGSPPVDRSTLTVTNQAVTGSLAADAVSISTYVVPAVPAVAPAVGLVSGERTVTPFANGSGGGGITYAYAVLTGSGATQVVTQYSSVIGSFTGGGDGLPFVVTFNALADLAIARGAPAVRDVIAATTFVSVGQNPSGERSLVFVHAHRDTDGSVITSSDPTGAAATVVIGQVNDAPTAAAVQISGPLGTSSTATITVTDPDSGVFGTTVTTAPTKGVLTVDAPVVTATGCVIGISYMPSNGASGSDNAVIRVSDGYLTVNVTVSITITAAPAITTTLATMSGVPVDGTLPATVGGFAVTYTVDSGPSMGVLTWGTPAAGLLPFTYAPNAGGTALSIETIGLSALQATTGVIIPATITVSVTPATIADRPRFIGAPATETAVVGAATIIDDLAISSSFTADAVDFALLQPVSGAVITPVTGRSARLTFTPPTAGIHRITVVVVDPTTKASDVRVFVIAASVAVGGAG